MKSVFFILAVWLLLPHHAIGQQNYYWPRISHDAFRRGEKLCYRIHYGFIDAVRAQIEITGENKQFQNRNTLHVIGTGWSKGTFDFFFKVRDRYETYIDEEALVPHQFIRRVDEGGYRMSQDYLFNHPLRKVNDNGKWYSIPENIQDMLSGFYLARTFSFGAASLNQVYTVPTLVDGELYQLQIRFKGRETIKTDFGKIRCLRFVPVVQRGRIFKHEEDLVVWLSDDKNHIPVRAKADILFGSLKVDLLSYSGLVNPLQFF